MKLLVAVDGSDHATLALGAAAKLAVAADVLVVR